MNNLFFHSLTFLRILVKKKKKLLAHSIRTIKFQKKIEDFRVFLHLSNYKIRNM